MIPKYRFWHIAEKKMYEVVSIHWMTGMVEVASGKYFLIPQDGSLMQSTGLFDSQPEPVEIYKDDIVRRILPNGTVLIGVVEFVNGMFLVDGIEAISSDVVVIDNIHQHPHLLEVSHEQATT